MRKIKFRIWDMDRKVMLDSQGIIFYYGDFYEDYRDFEDGTALDNIEVMQYTGLKDKNGIEIYEGDIVRFKFKNETRIGFVEYVRSSFLINVGEIICDNKIRHSFSNSSSEEHEIIGNVYQNKDLEG